MQKRKALTDTATMKGAKEYEVHSCDLCSWTVPDAAPAQKYALQETKLSTMAPAEDEFMHAAAGKIRSCYDKNIDEKEVPFKDNTVKGSQFKTASYGILRRLPGTAANLLMQS